jgi:Ca2+-binding EF-hand superfamily protein
MKTLNRYAIAALVGSFALSGAALAGDDKLDRLDADKDGKITAAEYSAGSKSAFDKLDANADGKVTAAEMDAAYTTSKAAVGAAKAPSGERIKAMDTDGDGSLSAVEHEAGSRTMFDALDANKDGSLTAEEIKAAHEAKEGTKSY